MTEERNKAKIIAAYDGWNVADDPLLDKYITSLDWLQPVAVKVMMQCVVVCDVSRNSGICDKAKLFAHHVHVGLITVRPDGETRYLELLDAVCKAIHFVELHKDLIC